MVSIDRLVAKACVEMCWWRGSGRKSSRLTKVETLFCMSLLPTVLLLLVMPIVLQDRSSPGQRRTALQQRPAAFHVRDAPEHAGQRQTPSLQPGPGQTGAFLRKETTAGRQTHRRQDDEVGAVAAGGKVSPGGAAGSDPSPWSDVPDAMPGWVRHGFHWRQGPIARGRPHWQVMGSRLDAFLYAAHFDDVQSPPVVRVVGLLHKMVAVMNVTCRYYDTLHGPGVLSAPGVLYHFRGLNGRKYVGGQVDCSLPEGPDYLPYAVSVSGLEEKMAANFMIVRYSQSDQWLHRRNASFLARTRENGGEQRSGDRNKGESRKESQKETGSGWKWNITRCFPAIHNRLNDHVTLAEMVAASLAMGVQHFVFYVESAGPDLTRMLQVLERKGLAEVHPWNMHLSSPTVFYVAQSSSIQECFYRHLRSSKFLLFGDIDELFVPRRSQTLLPLLNQVLSKNGSCGAVAFRNAFFNLNRTTRLPPGYTAEQPLRMLTHTRRIKYVWPTLRRSKPAVDPERVVAPGIHFVEKMRKGYKACSLDPAQGLLHHYRIVTRKEARPMAEIEDTSLWRYTGDMDKNYQELLREFHLEVKGQVVND